MSDIILSTGEIITPDAPVGLVSNRISARAIPRSARVQVCEGGLIVKRQTLSPVCPPVGSPRGEIFGFSIASRGRLIRRLLSVSWSRLINGKHSSVVRGLFITLTYPDIFPDAFERWKRDLHTFSKRLEREYPALDFIWKMELKARKSGKNKGEIAPHFHLLAYTDKGVPIGEFRKWLSMAWYEVVGSGDAKHYRAGTQAKRVYGTVEKLMSYCSKYLAKEFYSEDKTGRVWGERGELPRGEVYTLYVSHPEFIRRLRSWGRLSSYLRSLSVWRSGFVVFGACGQLLRGICVPKPVSVENQARDYTLDKHVVRLLNERIRRREYVEYQRSFDERDGITRSVELPEHFRQEVVGWFM